MTSSAGSAGVFTTDVALVVQSWDGWLAAATGITEEEARGRPLGELFPELESRGLLARLRHVSESGEVAVLAPAFHEYLLPCPPRARATHFARMQQHVTLAPLRAADAIVGVMVTLEDVTARRDRERELARQLKSDDESERLHAARELAESEGAGQLVAALGDRSWRVRRAAVDGLSIERDDAAIDALVAAVRERHRDPAVLNAALSALVHTDRDVVPRLAPLMDDEDADVRTYAALALGLLEDTRGVTRLVAALDDENANVRFHAIEALGRIGSREAALPLAAVAESRDFSVAFAALDALAHIGEPSVAPRLVPLLDDDLLQAAAAEALGALGGPEATGPLARLLDGADAPVEALATALVALDERQGDDAALVPEMVRRNVSAAGTRALVDALPRAAESTRPAIVRVLGWLDGDGIDDVLAGALADPATCAVASDALVSRGARAVEPLVQVLESERGSDAGGDADDLAHRAAAAALGRLGAASAVPALIALLDDAPDVAVVAAGALGHIGDRRAFEPLLAALDHPHAALRQVAVSALNSLGHPELTERLPALLRDSSPRVREAAARVAGYLGDPALLDAMLALHADDDETVQRAAVEQLVRFEDPRATAAVADALAHGTPAVRAAAARALAHGEPRDAIARLTAACDDPDPWVRYYAARSLGHVGRHSPREAARVLVALAMHDPVPPVRIAALDALATLGEVAEAGALRTIADDPDPAVAAPALAALGASRGRDTLEPLLAALGHADRVRRLAALDALARRADADAVPAAAAVARHSSDSEERTRGLEVLAATDDERAVAALVDVARDPRRTGTVVATLATLPETRIPWLRRALDDGDVHLRCALIEGLGRMRHRAASVLLAEALREPHPAVHAAAAHALGRADLRATAG